MSLTGDELCVCDHVLEEHDGECMIEGCECLGFEEAEP